VKFRTMLESSIAVRDAAGNVTAYQGFILDITDESKQSMKYGGATANF